MIKPLANYNIDIEKKWQNFWKEIKVYTWNENLSREENFVIDTPPPTISGDLHMGHMYSYTQADFIARFMRMKGMNVFYPIGFDDNGLPTERLVEKVKSIRANNMPREEFIAICKEVVAVEEEKFRDLFSSIALSVDWDQEYQTISDSSITMSQMSFLELFSKDRAYRKLQPTLWDSVDQTAQAQADIVDVEQKGLMNDIIFKTNKGENITIATTRPELLAACVAIFFNPEDDRYKHLGGEFAITPLFGAKVKIMADPLVAIDKGTGLVMCCTFGDITDIAWWKSHNLDTKVILNKYGKIIDLENLFGNDQFLSIDIELAKNTAKEITGLKVRDARSKIIEILKEHNLITNQVEVTQVVKSAERSGAPLEILVSDQWFIKILDQKEKLLEKADECNWHPAYMKTRLVNWINGLSWDWCISRQRYFGVPFPIWYSKRSGEEGKILVPNLEQLPVNPLVDLPNGYSRDEVIPDYDVMDTWATSSISPQLNSKAISKDFAIDYERHNKLFPADLRPQAHDIIRTWAFYTIVKSLNHQNSIPWKNLMISGWCLAADKTKMSKSKGNTVLPNALIAEHGSDVVRYWASTFRLGADTAYSTDILKIGKKLVNKIWNATKFVSIHLDKIEKIESLEEEITQKNIYHIIDLWIISKLNKTIALATEQFEKFEYCNARMAIEDFFWNDFCDNYLELIKVRIYNEVSRDDKASMSAIKSVYFCLMNLLKLFAPFIPHVTEEIYNSLFREDSIHKKGNWPKANSNLINDNAEETGLDCVNILNIIRKFKAEQNISLKTAIEHVTIYSEDKLPDDAISELKNVANISNIILSNEKSENNNLYITDDKKWQIEIKL